MVFLWHEIHVSKITIMSLFLFVLWWLIIATSCFFRSQELLKTIQKNKNLAIFSLNFSTNSKQTKIEIVAVLTIFDFIDLRPGGGGGGGGGGLVECNMTMTVRCPFLLNTGNRYSLFGEKIAFQYPVWELSELSNYGWGRAQSCSHLILCTTE